MTREENVFLVKRNIVDFIYKSAKLEGIDLTFPEIYAIYEGSILEKVSIYDVNKVLNLKYSWRIILNSLDQKINIDYFCKLHKEVGRGEALEWGVLRNGNVGISGTNYKPEIPNKKIVEEELKELLKEKNSLDRAIKIMFWAMKKQLFWDCNKRTAMLIANKIMIENGQGIISIPVDKITWFNTVLSDFYSNNTIDNAVNFIKNNCIEKINYSKTKIKNIEIEL